MTTAAQAAPSRAEIDRDTVHRATGPRTDAGKQRVRFNALKHGMRAKTPVLPGENRAAFQARLDAWIADLQPRDEIERFLVTRAVEVSWRLDRVRHALEARRAAARFAESHRLAAQAEEVVALGRRLFFDPVGPLCLYPHAAPVGGEVHRVSWSGDPGDPDDPARLVVRLEAMALGCAWLLDRWEELRDILECGLLWQPHDRLKAVRMLGRQPLDAPDDKRVLAIYLCGWAMDPNDHQGFTDMVNELAPGERKVFVNRLNNRDAMDAMPPGPEAARAMLLALIAEEEERLEVLLAGHLERDDAQAAAELAFDDSAYGERLRRYEAENDRALLRIIETLRKRRRSSDLAGPPPPSVVEPAPAPAEPSSLDATPTEPAATGPVPTPACMDPCTNTNDGWASSEAAQDPTEAAAIPETGGDGIGDAAAESDDPAERVNRFAPAILAALLGLFALLGFTAFFAASAASREVAPSPHSAQVERVETEFRPRGMHPASPAGGVASLSVSPGRCLGGLTVRPPLA